MFALRPSQLAEIAFDKWDTDYSLRRHFVRAAKACSARAILLPSSYSNVSRALVAFARMLPHRRFLLVVTRRNGRLQNLPANVAVRSLALYAPRVLPATEEERTSLLARWLEMQNKRFETNPVFRLARKLRVFDGFPAFLKSGLRVRDAWREVFAREPITAVLSADEYNPFTRLPTLLARTRKLHTVFCDHGALNLGFGIRRPVSDTYLVKGEMARDYCVSWGGLAAAEIVVGGPAEPGPPLRPANVSDPAQRDWIVFYSEEYELSSGRTQTFYAELLPELCALASQTNRKVIVKLHPFESRRVRKLFVDKALSAEQRSLVEICEGPMTPDLFARAWCSFTVESSVAVESTMNRVPCFLCGWFDASWYDYGKQYAKFSAGYTLDSPQQIRDVPRLLEQVQITEATRRKPTEPHQPRASRCRVDWPLTKAAMRLDQRATKTQLSGVPRSTSQAAHFPRTSLTCRGCNPSAGRIERTFCFVNNSPCLYIFDHEQRPPKLQAAGLAWSAPKLDHAEGFLGRAHRLYHRLEFLGLQ